MFDTNFFVLAFFCGGGVVMSLLFFGFLALLRFINYRETLALADKGIIKQPKPRRNGKASLRWGIIISALGLAITLGLMPLGILFFPDSRFPLGFGPWMVLGLLPLFFGLSLILVYILADRDSAEEPIPLATPIVPQPVKMTFVAPDPLDKEEETPQDPLN